MVLDTLERQSTGGDRGTQRDMERSAPQDRVQSRDNVVRGVRVLCGVRHAGASL